MISAQARDRLEDAKREIRLMKALPRHPNLVAIVCGAAREQGTTAEVVIVDPVLEAASGTFTVQLDLPNADRALPAGLRCQVRFSPGSGQPELAGTHEPGEAEVALAESPEGLRAEHPPSLDGLAWEPTASAPPSTP